MSEVFFERKHSHLQNDYAVEGSPLIDGQPIFHENCLHVAIEMARLLKAEGKEPKIIRITRPGGGTYFDGGGPVGRNNMVPKPFEGRIEWRNNHLICMAEELVYDPMLPSPLPLGDYLAAAFDHEVELEDTGEQFRRSLQD